MSGSSGAPMDAALVAALNNIGNQDADQVQQLENRRKELKAETAQVGKELVNKKKRDSRLLEKAARTLSPEACLQLASRKLASQAKAKAKAHAKAHA